ncbi:MAG: phosphotransferase [Defluviimonas sp.]|uniref:aminoglycoside phosphotransferase family protein n=1 Tax=Albidovulum sp. TaxID=1872424 RepID=UPI002A30626E|nr:phosphotransferase [Defluviimonas sp.]
MTERSGQIAAFLAEAGWAAATRTALAGDASSRRYARLSQAGQSAILMDHEEGRGEGCARFVRIALWLRHQGYSAPAVLADGSPQGLLLLEDLGDRLLARVIAAEPGRDATLTRLCARFLADLGTRQPPAFLPRLEGAALGALTEITPRWYRAGIGESAGDAGAELASLIESAFVRLDDGARAVSLRDFHAENAIWLPERSGLAQLGLLDFQDATITHPAYDIVSLLQDARRDLSPGLAEAALAGYLRRSGQAPERFAALYALLGAQRALRIIGVFTRLVLHAGSVQYLGYLPRVWGHLEANLAHPALKDIAAFVRRTLPHPTPARLERISAQCGRNPMP